MEITCPACNKVFTIPERNIPEGKKVTTRCKKCRGRIVVEARGEHVRKAAPKNKLADNKQTETEIQERGPQKRERFKLKESGPLMPKVVGICMVLFGVIVFLFRHSIPGGVEIAVFAAIIWPIFGIVGFLFGIKIEKYFIEISAEGINVNNTEIIPLRDIKEVELDIVKYKGFYLGEQIVIYHFDKKGNDRVTRLSAQLNGREKLYAMIQDHIKSHPSADMKFEKWL